EGLRLTALVRVAKTSPDDLFSLLLASSADAIGDVSLAANTVPAVSKQLTVARFDEVSFSELFERSISTTDPIERAADVTIAGVQPKVSAARLSLPVGVAKRSARYILKLNSSGYPRLVQNEHFFMELA